MNKIMKHLTCSKLVFRTVAPLVGVFSVVFAPVDAIAVESPTPKAGVTSKVARTVDLQSIDKSIKQSLDLVLATVQDELKKPNRELHRNLSDEVRLDFAIDLLGKYRSREAVMFLVDNVSLRTHGISLSLRRFGGFPAVGALIQIGNPSVQEILRRMKPLDQDTEYQERDLRLFAYIIREVDGQEIGLLRLQLAAKDSTGTHKLNLLNLMEIYEKHESELQIRRAIEPELESQPPVAQ